MRDIDIIPCTDIERIVKAFHYEGVVAVSGTLTPDQLACWQAGTRRVVAEQMAAVPLEEANRGFARYSFGQLIHEPEWVQFVDLPTVLPILEAMWGSPHFTCAVAGGDYSTPGAKIQPLHADMLDFLHDPLGQVTFRDVPAPIIVVNFLMVDFTERNGATRVIPCTHRSRIAPPTLEDEPDWMKRSIVCAPAGTAVFRDIRGWHGGTANRSDQIRPMTATGYYAPWFRSPGPDTPLPRAIYDTLSSRGQELCRNLVNWWSQDNA